MSLSYVSVVPPEGGEQKQVLLASAGQSFKLPSLPYPPDTNMVFTVWCAGTSATTVSMDVLGKHNILEVDTRWNRLKVNVSSPVGDEIVINVPYNAGIYFYKAQLETGGEATDWVSAPEDVETSIEDVVKRLRMYFDFTDQGLIIHKRSGDGEIESIWSSVTDNTGFKVVSSQSTGLDGSGSVFKATDAGVIAKAYECGEMRVRASSFGGWVWTDRIIL